jgi:hypothetical protein
MAQVDGIKVLRALLRYREEMLNGKREILGSTYLQTMSFILANSHPFTRNLVNTPELPMSLHMHFGRLPIIFNL